MICRASSSRSGSGSWGFEGGSLSDMSRPPLFSVLAMEYRNTNDRCKVAPARVLSPSSGGFHLNL